MGLTKVLSRVLCEGVELNLGEVGIDQRVLEKDFLSLAADQADDWTGAVLGSGHDDFAKLAGVGKHALQLHLNNTLLLCASTSAHQLYSIL